MSETPDELAGSEQPFIQHLVELRDRLVKAAIAVFIAGAALAIYPGPADLYDLLAAPLVAQLPHGSIENFDDGRLFIGAASGALPVVGVCGAGFVFARKKIGFAFGRLQHFAVHDGCGVLLLLCVWAGV